jgi:predicted AAA+ superfamily ATPase
VRDDDLRTILATANPWWRAAVAGSNPTAWIQANRLLKDRNKYDLGYRSPVLNDLKTAPIGDDLIFLTGPRRIGKSVALLELAEALCGRSDLDSRQIIHVYCDTLAGRDIQRIITLARDMTKSIDRPTPRRRVWLLDEVTSISNWSSILKAARDQSIFGDDLVVVSGSRWSETGEARANLSVGRVGTSNVRRSRHVLPMSFRDFLKVTSPQLALPTVVHPSDLQCVGVRNELESLAFEVEAYDLAWQSYLTCGGFPRAVYEYDRNGGVSLAFSKDLAEWIRTDLDTSASQESVPLLLAELVVRAASPLNITNTAKALGYSSADTFRRRLQKLESIFAAVKCPHRNDMGRVLTGSHHKLYLMDPLLAWIPGHLRSGLKSPNMTVLSEMAVGVALARTIELLEEGRLMDSDTIGFTRTNTAGQEIDLSPVLLPTTGGASVSVPIESKWVDDGWRREAKVIEAKYQRGILATKSLLDLDNSSWAVPAPLLVLLLG